MGSTILDKVWDEHIVAEFEDRPSVLYIDLHLIHEVTSPQAFTGLRRRGLKVRRPDRTLATMDHCTPTRPGALRIADGPAAAQLNQLAANCCEFGIEIHPVGSPGNGIVHVIAPETGRTQPGMTIVCGDSHTSTHGAFGSLAFGIGTTEVEHVLANQCLLQRRPKAVEIRVDGQLRPGVTAKDIILAIIAKVGVAGGTGSVFEYTGSGIRGLDMEARMTVCNMSIEAGARAGMIAPDDTTFEYMTGRPHVPTGAAWDDAVSRWKGLRTDDDATYDNTVQIDADALQPMISYGTNPSMSIPITGTIPDPQRLTETDQKVALQRALTYMGLTPGRPLLGHKIDVVFIGSCTNSRLSDLRQAARVLEGRRIDPSVRALAVPGSAEVKRQAEAEGLHTIFTEAGVAWREPGCSMCIAMNGDQLTPGQYAVSTSNRNFEGRQGPGGRTFLASPLTAAASAVTGEVTDVRSLMGERFSITATTGS